MGRRRLEMRGCGVGRHERSTDVYNDKVVVIRPVKKKERGWKSV